MKKRREIQDTSRVKRKDIKQNPHTTETKSDGSKLRVKNARETQTTVRERNKNIVTPELEDTRKWIRKVKK